MRMNKIIWMKEKKWMMVMTWFHMRSFKVLLTRVKLRTGNWHYSGQVLQCNQTCLSGYGSSLLSQLAREDAAARELEGFVDVGVANPVRCTEPRYSGRLSCSISWVRLM